MGFVVSWHVGSSQTRDRTRIPCIGRQILNPWPTREVPPPFQQQQNGVIPINHRLLLKMMAHSYLLEALRRAVSGNPQVADNPLPVPIV